MAERLKAGVVGAGVFGTFHARKYAAMEGVDLVAIVDPDKARAGTLADELHAKAFTDLAAALPLVDIITIAAPATFHFKPAKQALEAGKHVLVEKPIALDLAHADELIELANAKGLVLQVGHQERFVFDALGILGRDIAPSKITATRAGPFSGRAMDTSVIMDLMIHDLDLVHQVIPGAISDVSATSKTIHGDHTDEVTAHLAFASGAHAELHASRIAEGRDRTMSLTYPDGVIAIDFVDRTVTNSTPAKLGDLFGDDKSAVMTDPLGYAVTQFVAAVQNSTQPVVTGQCGRRALETALKIQMAAKAAA